MARKLRYFVPSGYYPVYARGGRGEFIYAAPVRGDHWLRTVKAVAQDFDLGILAYCLMRNHYLCAATHK
jgi:REP element-mobilizing transposase RayT